MHFNAVSINMMKVVRKSKCSSSYLAYLSWNSKYKIQSVMYDVTTSTANNPKPEKHFI